MSRAAKNLNHGLISTNKNVESCSPDIKSKMTGQMPVNMNNIPRNKLNIPSPTKSAADKSRIKIK